MRNQHRSKTIPAQLVTAALVVLASACSGDVIDLGEFTSQLPARASLCQASTSVDGSVLVENQEQLDQLARCEEIRGDLRIRPFTAPDFRPLASLRTVGGTLELGRLPIDTLALQPFVEISEYHEIDDATLLREIAIVNMGWLSSFDGFQALQRAGNLILQGVSAPSLQAFSQLALLADGGHLHVGPCTNLRDLTGLEGVSGLIDFSLACDSLESLAGLSFPSRMRDVVLTGSRLTDLSEFEVEVLDTLLIHGTALESLDVFSPLVRASRIVIEQNPALVHMDGLNALRYTDELVIRHNARLTQLPEFTALWRLNSLSVAFNDALTAFGAFPNMRADPALGGPEEPLPDEPYRIDRLEIIGNPGLVQLSVPNGWEAAGYVTIDGNAKLQSIAFSTLEAIDSLLVQSNPDLQSVYLGALATVDALSVIDNPLLPLNAFDGVRTYDSELSASPGDEQP